MGSMTSPSSNSLCEIFDRLDARIRHVDEERWISSRYASADARKTLITLYAFCYELARVRLVVSDQAMGAIRFQWWRDALEELEQDEVRQHDVVLALKDRLELAYLSVASLSQLVDGYETAYETYDRAAEPEAVIAAIAANVLAAAHSWGEEIRKLAPHWAALRRGEASGCGPQVQKAPRAIRPAIAHYRLRQHWGTGKTVSPFSMRLSILRAALTGRV